MVEEFEDAFCDVCGELVEEDDYLTLDEDDLMWVCQSCQEVLSDG